MGYVKKTELDGQNSDPIRGGSQVPRGKVASQFDGLTEMRKVSCPRRRKPCLKMPPQICQATPPGAEAPVPRRLFDEPHGGASLVTLKKKVYKTRLDREIL